MLGASRTDAIPTGRDWGFFRVFPGIAPVSQPRAECLNPFGIPEAEIPEWISSFHEVSIGTGHEKKVRAAIPMDRAPTGRGGWEAGKMPVSKKSPQFLRFIGAMKRVWRAGFLGLALALGLVASGRAAEGLEAGFNQANQLYEKGNYAAAAAAYQKLAAGGRVSAALLFNEGNAWFKAGKMGQAIAAYREAGELAPRDPDIRANLRFAREQVKSSKPPISTKWLRWSRFLTLNEWSATFALATAAWFVLLILRTARPAWKAALGGYTAAAGLLSLGFAGTLAVAARLDLVERTVVVILPEAVVRHGPVEESQSYFTAPDGAELLLVDERGDWVEVADGAGRVGWVPGREVVVVRGGINP